MTNLLTCLFIFLCAFLFNFFKGARWSKFQGTDVLTALTKSVKNHLTVSSLQPRGLVALISSLGTFSASWNEIEEINLEIELNNIINKNDKNNIINGNKKLMNSEEKQNEITTENKREDGIENESINVIKKDHSTLSYVFSETVERYFPDLSNAEIYQVRINYIFHFPFFVLCFLFFY